MEAGECRYEERTGNETAASVSGCHVSDVYGCG